MLTHKLGNDLKKGKWENGNFVEQLGNEEYEKLYAIMKMTHRKEEEMEKEKEM